MKRLTVIVHKNPLNQSTCGNRGTIHQECTLHSQIKLNRSVNVTPCFVCNRDFVQGSTNMNNILAQCSPSNKLLPYSTRALIQVFAPFVCENRNVPWAQWMKQRVKLCTHMKPTCTYLPNFWISIPLWFYLH